MTRFPPHVSRLASIGWHRVVSAILSLAVVCMGCFTLGQWQAEKWQVSTFGSGYIPMEPITAALFALLGAGLGMQAVWSARKATRWLTWFAVGAAVVVAGSELARQDRSFPLPWEAWGFGVETSAGPIAIGRMFPTTAWMFLLAAIGLGALERKAAATGVVAWLGSVAALLGGGWSLVVWVSYVAGSPLGYADGGVPMAFLTAVAFVILQAGILVNARGGAWVGMWQRKATEGESGDRERCFLKGRILCVLLAFAGALGVLAFGLLRTSYSVARDQVDEQLTAIVALKVGQIAWWRKERLADAEVVAAAPCLKAYLAEPDAARLENLGRYMETVRRAYGYRRVALYNSNLEPVVESDATPGGDGRLTPTVLEKMREARKAMNVDLHAAAGERTHMDFIAPLRSVDGDRFEGVIQLTMDAATQLFTLIDHWPTPSLSGETLLVRDDDGAVEFLNKPHRSRTESAVLVERALRGKFPKLIEGPDYAGVPSFAVARRVPGSPWVVFAKVDKREAYALVRREALTVMFGVALLLALAGLALRVWWSHGRRRWAEQKLMEERLARIANERLALVLLNANDVVLLIDVEMRIVEVNERVRSIYGHTPERLRKMTMADLLGRGASEGLADRFEMAFTAEGRVYETVHRRADGTEFPVEVSARRVEIEGAPHLLAFVRDITERKRTEAKIRQLSSIVEQAPLSIAITGLEGLIEYANPNFSEISGYALEELIGQNPRVLKSGRTAPEVYTEMWRTLSRGEVWKGEMCNRKKNGEFYDEWAVIAPVKDPGGKVTHYVALKQDITESKAAAVAVRESEQSFRELFDLESDAIVVLDVATKEIVQANHAAQLTYGYGTDELVGMNAEELSAEPEKTRALFGMLRNENESVVRVPLRWHRRRDGSLFPVEIGIRAFRRGGRALFVAVVRDISDQQRIREQLQRFNAELEEKVARRTREIAARGREMEALLRAIPDLVMRMGKDGGVTMFQAAQGATPLARFAPGAVELCPLVKAACEAGAGVSPEAGIVSAEVDLRLEGEAVSVELRAAATSEEEFVVFVRDITMRKRIEAEVAAMLEKERKVSELKTRFISTASHEFRTPMAIAMAAAELLIAHGDGITPAKHRDLLERIITSLHRIVAMLDDVLNISRIESGRTKVEVELIEPSDFLRRMIDEVRQADRSAHHFEFSHAGVPGPFATDAGLMQHILSNLLSNAARYSPAGSTVRVEAEVSADELRVAVTDEGIGIPEAELESIFEPFERGSNVGAIKGTGLGLNIAKRQAVLLGGSIVATNAAGGGARFTLAIPRLREPDGHTSLTP